MNGAERVPREVHHIAFLVRDMETRVGEMSRLLGRDPEQRGPVPYRDAEVVIFKLDNVRIELVAPKSESSPLASVLEAQGEGFFHIGFGVDDLAHAGEVLSRRGFEMSGPPRVGYKDWELTYLERGSFPLFAAHLIAAEAE